jgi:hypothetical protein
MGENIQVVPGFSRVTFHLAENIPPRIQKPGKWPLSLLDQRNSRILEYHFQVP